MGARLSARPHLRFDRVSGPPSDREQALRLSVPEGGIRSDRIVLRFPSLDDVDAILPAFTDPDLREAGNLPAFDRAALVASIQELPLLAEAGRLLALAAVDAETTACLSLGVERVAAYVNVGNIPSERVVERAGFTREGVVRSMPIPDGRRVDKTLFSLLPNE